MVQRADKRLAQLDFYARIIYSVKSLRYLFFFYSFISFVFWFLNCFEVEWLYRFDWLFAFPYQIVSIFYVPEGITVDLSLAFIGSIALILGLIYDFIMNIFYNQIIALQEEEEKRLERQKMFRQKKRKRLQPRPIQSGEGMPIIGGGPDPFAESKLVFLILPHVKKIRRKKDDLELTFQEVETWKQRVNKKLIENISYSKPMQKGYYRKNLFLVYKDFNYVDDFVYYITPTLDSIILEFKKYGVITSFSYVLSAISNMDILEKELDCMDTVLSLNFINEFVVTNRFKVTYDNKSIQKYSMELKGEYNLSKNLTISNRQPLYTLYDRSKGKQEGEKQ